MDSTQVKVTPRRLNTKPPEPIPYALPIAELREAVRAEIEELPPVRRRTVARFVNMGRHLIQLIPDEDKDEMRRAVLTSARRFIQSLIKKQS